MTLKCEHCNKYQTGNLTSTCIRCGYPKVYDLNRAYTYLPTWRFN